MKPDDVIKMVDYIKKQAGYNGDIFINVNVNAIPIEWLINYEIKNGQETRLQEAITQWEKENADL